MLTTFIIISFICMSVNGESEVSNEKGKKESSPSPVTPDPSKESQHVRQGVAVPIDEADVQEESDENEDLTPSMILSSSSQSSSSASASKSKVEEKPTSASPQTESDPDEPGIIRVVETIDYGGDEEVPDDEDMIKKKYGPPEVIQIIAPPDLSLRKLISSDLNSGQPPGRRAPETPASDEPVDEQSQDLYNLAMNLLGPAASREATSVHIVTSVGKTQAVDQAYHYLSQAALRGHKKSMELVALAQLVGPLPLDIESAKEKFAKLAEEGYPNSQTAMGFLHTNGLHVKLNSADRKSVV